jgi:hypothetical protein
VKRLTWYFYYCLILHGCVNPANDKKYLDNKCLKHHTFRTLDLNIPCNWTIKQELAADGSYYKIESQGDYLSLSSQNIFRVRDSSDYDAILLVFAKELEMKNPALTYSRNITWVIDRDIIMNEIEFSAYGEDTTAWLSYYFNGRFQSSGNLQVFFNVLQEAKYVSPGSR